MCPLKYALEALTINEANMGLQIEDTLQGVTPVESTYTFLPLPSFLYSPDNH